MSRGSLSLALLLFTALLLSMQVSTAHACEFFTPGYWKNHPDAWPVEEISIGGVTRTKTEAIGILKMPPKGGDATVILAHALIAAKLNLAYNEDLYGWTPPTPISDAISDADDLLSWAGHAIGTNPRCEHRATMLALAEILDDFNNYGS